MVVRRSICVPHVQQHDHRTAGSPEVYASAQRMVRFPTTQLISLADAEDDGGRGLPRFRGAHVGSTKVLATKGSGKTPAVYTNIASAVAFMGPKRRRPPVFYFSSMIAEDAEALATDSSLSAHLASVAASMARPPAWESRALGHRNGRRGTRRRRGWQKRRPCAAPHRAGPERRFGEPRASLGQQLAPSG